MRKAKNAVESLTDEERAEIVAAALAKQREDNIQAMIADKTIWLRFSSSEEAARAMAVINGIDLYVRMPNTAVAAKVQETMNSITAGIPYDRLELESMVLRVRTPRLMDDAFGNLDDLEMLFKS